MQWIVTHEVVALRASESPAATRKRTAAEELTYRASPVINADRSVAGVGMRDELRNPGDRQTVVEMLSDPLLLAVVIDTPIRDAANPMILRNLQHVPVIGTVEPKRLLGWLPLNNIACQ